MEIHNHNQWRYHKSVLVERDRWDNFPDYEPCMRCLEETDRGIIIDWDVEDKFIFMCSKCAPSIIGVAEHFSTDKKGSYTI